MSPRPDCNDGDATINPKTVWYGDTDGDGYGDAPSWSRAASAPRALWPTPRPDDADATLSPRDFWFADLDGDGFGNIDAAIAQCEALRASGAMPTTAMTSRWCHSPETLWYADGDGDGWRPGSAIAQCNAPSGWPMATTATTPTPA